LYCRLVFKYYSTDKIGGGGGKCARLKVEINTRLGQKAPVATPPNDATGRVGAAIIPQTATHGRGTANLNCSNYATFAA